MIILFKNEPIIFYSFVIIMGFLIGSFLNVVIYRLPIMLKKQWQSDCENFLDELKDNHSTTVANEDKTECFNLVTPRSTCPKCGHKISALENIPVLSYLFLLGKCRKCNIPISIRYPLIEILSALITLLLAWKFGVTITTLALMCLMWALIAASFIDYDHKILPDEIILPFIWIGLLFNSFFHYVPLNDAVLGAIIGYMTFWSLFHIFKIITGKDGMGYGDFKLLALLGAWLGWQSLLMIVLISSLTGAIIGITLILLKLQDRGKPIPFGPYLVFAGWVVLMWGEQLQILYYNVSGVTI